MRSYLIVANQTLASPIVANVIAERVAAGPARFHVVVPATPIQHGLTWNEEEAQVAARGRLDAAIARLHDLGVEASGEVGEKDPIAAVRDALREHPSDEIILSTLPPGISRWLGQDVPARLKGSVTVPVTVLTAAPESVESTSG
jgi:predicted TIM-barrel enzyme